MNEMAAAINCNPGLVEGAKPPAARSEEAA